MPVLVSSLCLDLSSDVLSDANTLNVLNQVAESLNNSVSSSTTTNFSDAVGANSMVLTPNGEVLFSTLRSGDVVKSVDGRDLVVKEVLHFVVNPNPVQKPILITSNVSRPTVLTYGAKVFTNRLIHAKYLQKSELNVVGKVHLVNLRVEGGSALVSVNGLGLRTL